MCGSASAYGKRRGAYRSLVGKPEGKKPLGKPVLRWKDIIEIDLQEIGWDIYKADDRNSCGLFCLRQWIF
jgi:hypothetical protein